MKWNISRNKTDQWLRNEQEKKVFYKMRSGESKTESEEEKVEVIGK